MQRPTHRVIADEYLLHNQLCTRHSYSTSSARYCATVCKPHVDSARKMAVCKRLSGQLVGLTTRPTTAGKAISIRPAVDLACLLVCVLNPLRYNVHRLDTQHIYDTRTLRTYTNTYVFDRYFKFSAQRLLRSGAQRFQLGPTEPATRLN